MMTDERHHRLVTKLRGETLRRVYIDTTGLSPNPRNCARVMDTGSASEFAWNIVLEKQRSLRAQGKLMNYKCEER